MVGIFLIDLCLGSKKKILYYTPNFMDAHTHNSNLQIITSAHVPPGQVVAAFMMIRNLKSTGFEVFPMAIPSKGELFQIFEIAAPVFITMTSKVLCSFGYLTFFFSFFEVVGFPY